MLKTTTNKILYVSPNGYLGGAEKFILEACTGHLEYGHFTPEVLFFNDGYALELFRKRGIQTHLLKNSFKLSRPIHLLKACLEIRKLFYQNHWTLYNATMPYAQFVMGLALMNLPLSRIWHQHGPIGKLLEFLASLFPYDYVFFNSLYTQREHHKLCLFREAKRGEAIVPLGIPSLEADAAEVEKIHQQYHPKPGSLLFLIAGRICAWKGYETTIKALDQLHQLNPELLGNFSLVIIGEAKLAADKNYERELKKLASQSLIKDRIYFLGRKENLGDYMRACDIFIHSSIIPEPFGLVVAEAMLRRTLVVGTNQGGTCDILKDGVTGLSFDSTAAQADKVLLKVLLKVLKLKKTNPELIRRIRNTGKLHIEKNFTIEKMVHKLESFYFKLPGN